MEQFSKEEYKWVTNIWKKKKKADKHDSNSTHEHTAAVFIGTGRTIRRENGDQQDDGEWGMGVAWRTVGRGWGVNKNKVQLSLKMLQQNLFTLYAN